MSDSPTAANEGTFREMLIRVDERTKFLADSVQRLIKESEEMRGERREHVTREDLEGRLTEMWAEINAAKARAAEALPKAEAKTMYVSIEAFEPVKRFNYGLIGVVLVAVLIAILALVMPRSGTKIGMAPPTARCEIEERV